MSNEAERIQVGIAQLEVARAPVRLQALALGSCVAVILHDPVAAVGGLAHVLLPSQGMGRARPDQPARSAPDAVAALLEKVLALGADRSRLTVRLVGGASMFATLQPPGMLQMGDRNLSAVRDALHRQRLRVIGEAVGGDFGRTVEFELATGRVLVSSYQKGVAELWSASVTETLAAELRAEFRAIADLLAGAPQPASREAAKRRIIGLFKRVEAQLTDLASLKEDIRGLVNRYKELAAQDGAEPIPGGNEPQLHRDHLGASTFVEKGWSLISLGDPAAAIQALNRALELSPGDPQAESLLGWAEMQSGKLVEARETFLRVLAHAPTNTLARVNLGFLCLKQRAFGEAIEQLSGVIRLDNDRRATLYAHYYLGLVYLERGMLADAQSFLSKAITLGPNLIEAYHDLGRTQWLAGLQDEARATWTAGAAGGHLTPWAKACQALLDRVARGEEVPR